MSPVVRLSQMGPVQRGFAERALAAKKSLYLARPVPKPKPEEMLAIPAPSQDQKFDLEPVRVSHPPTKPKGKNFSLPVPKEAPLPEWALAPCLIPAFRMASPSAALILDVVASRENVSKNDLLSARRAKSIVLPRQIAFYLARNLTEMSLPQIARRMGNRDHTTVLHGIRKINGMMKEAEFAARVTALENEISGLVRLSRKMAGEQDG